jgi:hypothetical protein
MVNEIAVTFRKKVPPDKIPSVEEVNRAIHLNGALKGIRIRQNAQKKTQFVFEFKHSYFVDFTAIAAIKFYSLLYVNDLHGEAIAMSITGDAL